MKFHRKRFEGWEKALDMVRPTFPNNSVQYIDNELLITYWENLSKIFIYFKETFKLNIEEE